MFRVPWLYLRFSHFKKLGSKKCFLEYIWGFPDDSDGKESACSVGDLGSIPGSERSPGEGNDAPFQYSCLENPMHRENWRATVSGVARVAHDWATKPPPPLPSHILNMTNCFFLVFNLFFCLLEHDLSQVQYFFKGEEQFTDGFVCFLSGVPQWTVVPLLVRWRLMEV